MGIIFGKSRKLESRVTEQDKSILQLKQQRDRIKQYQKRVEQNLAKDKEIARKLLSQGRRERAKCLLRKKRYLENLLTNTDSQLEQLERLTHDLEFSQVEMQVLDGLKSGNEALKKLNATLSIEDIENILEETREAVDKQREIDELLSGTLTDQDEANVESELEELIKTTLPEVPTTKLDDQPTSVVMEDAVQLPEVPTEEPGEKKKTGRIAVPAS